MRVLQEQPAAPHLCVQCAQTRPTCCQVSEVYVSPMDLMRIRAYLGTDEFWEMKAPADPSYFEQDDDPTWQARVFGPDRRRRILKRPEGGDCRFLSPAGCVLPMEVRPVICRLYPYKYNDRGIQGVELRCPVQLLPPGQSVLQALGMEDLATAQRWRAQLYKEILLEQHAPAPVEASGEPAPAA